MRLLNPSINRIIIHQVFQRKEADKMIVPIKSTSYTRFAPDAMRTFQVRVNDALGQSSRAVAMEIVQQDEKSLIQLVNKMADQNEDDFVESSYQVAIKLADAQVQTNYPGGIIVIFLGTQGEYQKKFLGIMKAEVHSGYEKHENPKTGEISLNFIEELLLTPSSRLYKTAGFFEKNEYDENCKDLNEKWAVMVSDSQINKADGKAAAQYFYSGFLGFGYPDTSARTTKLFYEATKGFIDCMDISQEKRNDLLNALVIYLRADLSGVVDPIKFADTYFETDTRDLFTSHIKTAGLPVTCFTKDTEQIESKLKTRKIKFKSKVNISAPADVFKELVEIKTINGEIKEGSVEEWTQVIVKDRIINQE
jgi:hypothetical protein